MDSSSAASRDRIKALYASREAMEHEMASIAQRLSGPGMPGLKGPLVDREGFPIPGVDLYAVRGDRGRYAVLRNDHAAVTNQMQRAMTDLHASAGALRGARPPRASRRECRPCRRIVPRRPLGRVRGASAERQTLRHHRRGHRRFPSRGWPRRGRSGHLLRGRRRPGGGRGDPLESPRRSPQTKTDPCPRWCSEEAPRRKYR